MARPLRYPEIWQCRFPPGTLAAIDRMMGPDQARQDVVRDAVMMWVNVPPGTIEAIRALPGSPVPARYALAALLAALARDTLRVARKDSSDGG